MTVTKDGKQGAGKQRGKQQKRRFAVQRFAVGSHPIEHIGNVTKTVQDVTSRAALDKARARNRRVLQRALQQVLQLPAKCAFAVNRPVNQGRQPVQKSALSLVTGLVTMRW